MIKLHLCKKMLFIIILVYLNNSIFGLDQKLKANLNIEALPIPHAGVKTNHQKMILSGSTKKSSDRKEIFDEKNTLESLGEIPHSANAIEWVRKQIHYEMNKTYREAEEYDLQSFIENELAAGNKGIKLPRGRLKLRPKKNVHLNLINLKGITIDASETEILCMETNRAIHIENCEDLQIKGLVIDYDPLPFTQGTIKNIAQDGSWFQVKIAKGYPKAKSIKMHKIELFNPQDNSLVKDISTFYGSKIEVLDDQNFKVILKSGTVLDKKYLGFRLITDTTNSKKRIPHTVVLENCKNTLLKEVTVFASNCFAFLELNCENNTYDRCRVDRRYKDFDQYEIPRLWSSNADAFHSISATKGPQYIQCVAMHQGDDCHNIHGTYHIVIEQKNEALILASKRDFNLQIGDSLEIISPSGKQYPENQMIEAEKLGPTSSEEREFWNQSYGLINPQIFRNKYKIKIKNSIHIQSGSIISAKNRKGSGFKIEGGYYGYNRSRALLLKASNGIVKNNRIVESRMSAIVVSPELQWMESGLSDNVRIENNYIENCSYGEIFDASYQISPITVVVATKNKTLGPAGCQTDIKILNNTITQSNYPLISISSTDSATIKDNNFLSNSIDPSRDERIRKNIYWKPSTKPVLVLNSTNVKVEHNKVSSLTKKLGTQ